MSIGVGPFVQQMAAIRNNRVNSDIPASTTRTEAFTEVAGFTHGQPTSDMMSAIYNALFIDSDTVNSDPNTYGTSVTPNCPTGGCDIPPFQTLAICSQCSDVSHLLTTREERGCESPIASFFLPNGLHLNKTIPGSDLISTSATLPHGGMEGLSGIKDFGPSAFFNLSAISAPKKAPLSNATATHCSLYWCVNTYSASMEGNRAKEKLVDTYHDAGAHYDKGTLNLRPPVKGSSTASNFSITDASSLTGWLVDKLQFNNTPNSWCNSQNAFTVDGEPKENEFLRIILNAPLSDSFGKIAAGMTKHVRSEQRRVQSYHGKISTSFSYPYIEPAHGTSWTVQTQLHVRWVWIILPALLIILTMIFLIVTALQSRHRRLDIWKSSTIPLLCSGLDLNIQQRIKAAGDPMQTEMLASRVYVRILKSEDTGDAWRLDAHDSVSR